MMISHSGLSRLKTKLVEYHNVFVASDSVTLELLKEISSKRRSMEMSVNGTNQLSEAIAREMSGGLTSRCEQDIQKLECYLPLLENLVLYVSMKSKDPKMISWISGLKLSWSSVLASSSILDQLKGPKFYQVDNVYFELGMTLFVYGGILREKAMEILPSDLVQSATFFRKAAGVYKYLAQEVLIHLVGTPKRPPEAICSISSILSLICLAEAQAVAARKAEENGKTKSLLSMLHSGVGQFLAEAINILELTTIEYKDLSSQLPDFISCCKTLHELKSYKYLAESLRDNGKIGTAIGVLRCALTNSKERLPRIETWKSVHQQVFDEVSVQLQKYERENQLVWLEKVAYNAELPSPQSKQIVSLIPYEPKKWERTLAFKL